MFSIRSGRAILRDITRDDIDTLIEWESKVITPEDYRYWDGPWEYEGLTEADKAEELERWRIRLNKRLAEAENSAEDDARSWFVIAPADAGEKCVGWCSSYYIDENCDYSSEPTDRTAVGIDIVDPAMRGSGLGYAALKLFIDYLTRTGIDRIYTQTWSGNERMISLAGRLGIKEIRRNTGSRTVRGGTYDGLTFELDREEFARLPEPEELAPLRALDELGIHYVRIAHPPANTMELCEGIGGEYGARHCKNLFLTNRGGNNFFLLLMSPDKPYRTSDVSKKLGVSRLSFASAEQLKTVLGLAQGSVSVMGMVNDSAKAAYLEGRLHIAIDADLLERPSICVHPNTNTATLVLSTADLIRFLNELGYEYSALQI